MFCDLGCDNILGPVRSTSDPATGDTDLSKKSNSAANQNDREEFLASGNLRLRSGCLGHSKVR